MVNQEQIGSEMSQMTANVSQNGLHGHVNHVQSHPQHGQQHPNHQQQHSNLDELLGLLRNDIPDGRRTLLDTRGNLEKVADYCATTYLDTKESQAAFEKTKNYTTHSLASVAFQINTLAFNILHMFDLQTNQIAEMESQMNYIGQKVAFHKEKVARREIALLTSTKNNIREPKVLVPANKEKQSKYIRKPIDYSVLDDIGHGVKLPAQQGLIRGQSIGGQQGSSGRMTGIQTLGPKSSMASLQQNYNIYGTLSGNAPAPTTKPPTPPQMRANAYGTLSRSAMNKDYRALAPPIAPPQVPKNYEQNYPMGHPKSQISQSSMGQRGNGNYMAYPPPGGVMQEPTYGQFGNGHSSMHSGSSIGSSQYGPGIAQHLTAQSALPPPPPNMMTHPTHGMNDSLPEPPPPSHFDVRNSTASPPLPPPPPPVDNELHHQQQQQQAMKNPNQIYNVTQRQHSVPDWAPPHFLERVIAIYDYTADKDDELTFQENSVIYVTKKNDDGWYEGVMNGLTGLFPGNYVEPTL